MDTALNLVFQQNWQRIIFRQIFNKKTTKTANIKWKTNKFKTYVLKANWNFKTAKINWS